MTPTTPRQPKKSTAAPRAGGAGAKATKKVDVAVDALAAGAARATGERSRRHTTPLLGATEPVGMEPLVGKKPVDTVDPSTPRAPRPERPSRAAVRERADAAGLRVVPDPPTPVVVEAPASRPAPSQASPVGAAVSNTLLTPDVGEIVGSVISVLRGLGSAAGLSGDALERTIASALAYLRRFLAGDYEIDEFGFDSDFTETVAQPLLRPLYQKWFRVEVRGIEHIPLTGGALIVANHSGTVPLDGVMTSLAVHDETPNHRFLRMLGADLVFKMPFVGAIARRTGTTLAANSDAKLLLDKGELVGVWPEGFKGIGKPFSERYKLQRFGRGGFVSAAIRSQVPIIPCSIVGAEEIYPIIGNLPNLARLLGVPYVPITATFPWLGPLGLIPLPSKWIIEFGEPIDTAVYGADAAEDPMVVFDLTDQVRETIQQTLYRLLLQRQSVFS